MYRSKQIQLVCAAAALAVLAFGFQNCAPSNASPGSSWSSNSFGGFNEPVGVIDNVNETTGVSFNLASEQIAGDVGVAIAGACSLQQNGATLSWELMSPSNGTAQIAAGQTGCAGGAFEVTIDPQILPQCGLVYVLQAQMGLGTPGTIELQKPCP